jgi:uncharacterized repeat protein (TIGR01451 family)
VAVLSPAQPSLAASNNDLINGGIGSRANAVSFCQQDVADYASILHWYGISCDDVARSAQVSLNSNDYNRQLFSMGRLPYGKTGETPVNAAGKVYYWRYLWSWDTNGGSTYQALKVTSSVSGKTYFILFNCGNLVSIGTPAPPARCQWNNTIFSTDSQCQPPKCALDKSLPATSPNCKACPYNSSILKNNVRCVACPYPGLGTITKDNTKCKPPCPYNSAVTADSLQCKPCSAAQTKDDKTACLVLSKQASNPTQGITDANGTTANPGDTIVYTMYAKNTGKVTVPKFVIQEDISDVLDYADVVDLHGGKLNDSTKMVTWAAQNIPANQTASEQITVKIKDPLPSTPVSTSDPGHYDDTMTNVYGNAINIQLPPTVAKATEQVVQALPNTGPGTGLFISFAVTLVAGYFFARSRLLSKETRIIMHTYQGGTV